MPGNSISTFDAKKIERLAKKASKKGVADATAYLYKVSRNSIKRSSGKKKDYDFGNSNPYANGRRKSSKNTCRTIPTGTFS